MRISEVHISLKVIGNPAGTKIAEMEVELKFQHLQGMKHNNCREMEGQCKSDKPSEFKLSVKVRVKSNQAISARVFRSMSTFRELPYLG